MWQVLINRFVTEFMSPNIVTFFPDLKKTPKGWAAYFWNKFIKLWCIRCRCRQLFCSRSFIDSTVHFLFDIWYKNAIVFFIYNINSSLQIKTANNIHIIKFVTNVFFHDLLWVSIKLKRVHTIWPVSVLNLVHKVKTFSCKLKTYMRRSQML